MVLSQSLRVVLDTNILVRGLLNDRSPSGQILHACEIRVLVPLLSQPVLMEYRAILKGPELVERFPKLKERRTTIALERLKFVGDLVRDIRVRFDLPRDPKDVKLVQLCIAGNATHLITTDNDLLELTHGYGDAAKQLRRKFPSLTIIKPNAFIQQYGLIWLNSAGVISAPGLTGLSVFATGAMVAEMSIGLFFAPPEAFIL